MFDHIHYVPVLRWRRAEKYALRELFQHDRCLMMPLIELFPGHFEKESLIKAGGLETVLSSIADQLSNYWGELPFFMDFIHLENQELTSNLIRSSLSILGGELRPRGLSMIPVTGIYRNRAYSSSVSQVSSIDGNGICLRININDLNRPTFEYYLADFINCLGRDLNEIDLILDSEYIGGQQFLFGPHISSISRFGSWRTLTLLVGSFPRDLTDFNIGEHLLERTDWIAWRDRVCAAADIPRLPTFGDYTIQHPYLPRMVRFPNVSASIRYTTDDHWVIMRGEGLRNPDGPGYAQYPANAMQLCRRSEYCGSGFSYGDSYIEELSNRVGSAGSPETLLRAGINHHLTFVVRQIASLFGSSDDRRL